MATPRDRVYIWATWLSRLLGGTSCQYSVWFPAHYEYRKFEKMASKLNEWNKEHTELMNERRAELEEAGFTVSMEGQNSFKLMGTTATLAGKPDITAKYEIPNDPYTLAIDGKTGIQKDSDIWQVRIYLYAIPRTRPDLVLGTLKGEVQYKRGDVRKPVTLTKGDEAEIVRGIKALAGPTPLPKVPSLDACNFCNIGKADCPARVDESQIVGSTADF